MILLTHRTVIHKKIELNLYKPYMFIKNRNKMLADIENARLACDAADLAYADAVNKVAAAIKDKDEKYTTMIRAKETLTVAKFDECLSRRSD